MVKLLKENFQQLYEVADSQCGLFTAKQAAAAGYSTRMQTYHVQSGDWDREWRGIYKLRFYPNPSPDDLMLWYLWSCDRSGHPEGVYSFDTALEIHGLSTWTGNRLHMTVPRDFKRSVVPKALRLHKGDLRHFEIARVRQLAVTTPTRTILDLLRSNSIQRHHIVEAMQDARKRGLITASDIKSPFWNDEDHALLQRLSDESRTYETEA
jgi:predicted transcriptional regulator of viral defense system